MKRFFLAVGFFLIFAFCLFGIFFAQSYTWSIIEDHFYEMGKNPGYIPTGDRLKPILLGFDHFAADLYWIKAAQYAGGNSGAFEFDSLPEYLELVTDLDPHFGFAYHFGALVFPLNTVAIEKVDDFLQKGIRFNRNSHPELLPQMYVDRAFYMYYYQDDLEKGAEIYEECAETLPDCPPYAEKVAAFLRARTGKHEIALRIWLERILEKQEKSEEEVNLELKKIEESSKLVALTCAAKNYEERYKRAITELSDLMNEAAYPGAGFTSLSQQQKQILANFSVSYDLRVISEKTLTTPFDHNPFEWDSPNKKVTAKLWKKKK